MFTKREPDSAVTQQVPHDYVGNYETTLITISINNTDVLFKYLLDNHVKCHNE